MAILSISISARSLATRLTVSALAFGLSAFSAQSEPAGTDNPYTLPRAEACALAETAPTDSNLEACYADLPASLPACASEDSIDCYWLAGLRGNGKGRSFVSIAGATVFLD